MTVERSLYATHFTEFPEWPCPTCGKGHLQLDKEKLLNVETGPSKAAHAHEEWDPEWIERRFAALLTCNFKNCGEVVAIQGNVSITEVYDWGDQGDQTREWIEAFEPRSLSPAPLPIRPAEDTPELVKGCLREAGSLIWQSAESAANQVRQAVEYLMDEQNVSKATPPVFTPLHNRIKEFEKKDGKNAEILLAVKWLGNSGSHVGGLTRDDVFDAFDMVELVLNNLYDTTTADIMAKVKAINTQKGPVKKP